MSWRKLKQRKNLEKSMFFEVSEEATTRFELVIRVLQTYAITSSSPYFITVPAACRLM